MSNPFQSRVPNLTKVRVPQRESYEALANFAADTNDKSKEVGIILPVGCGKSGCITLAPFAFHSTRTLVIAPGLNIAEQLFAAFHPKDPDKNFYRKCAVLSGPPYPEPAEIRGQKSNNSDLEDADVVVTNIQQLSGDENKWLNALPPDFFDLILFDEGHHSVADSYEFLKTKFPAARVVNFSATPQRADGQIMGGKVLYSFPVARAIEEGYVKRLKAVRLDPKTLRYVRREDSGEIEVSLEEVIELGETDAGFRRSVVTSNESLYTIVDASIEELQLLKKATQEPRLKIIASALNLEHCIQIVKAYRERGMKAEYVHTKIDGAKNKAIMKKLEAHEIEVIVQVRKLGEGFDHPLLSVAAVFSVFSNLSPFVQFVGRIMRVIEHDKPGHVKNQGVVVYHAGGNVHQRWKDFREFSSADQAYFAELLPTEVREISGRSEARDGSIVETPSTMEVRAQSQVELNESHLVDQKVADAVKVLLEVGKISPDEAKRILTPQPKTKQDEREAKRKAVDSLAMNEARKACARHAVDPNGMNLDKKSFNKTNLIYVKTAIDDQINSFLEIKTGKRHEVSRVQWESVEKELPSLITAAEKAVFRD